MKTPALISISATLLLSLQLSAQSIGPYFPGQTENQPLSTCPTCAGAIWNNTSKVSAADNIYSDVQLMPYLYCFQAQCYRSRYLTCHHFGFNIPGNANINGIVLNVLGKCNTPSSVMDSTVLLMKNNVPTGMNYASGNDWDTSNTARGYGSSNDLWGNTWTPQEVSGNYFGAYVKVYNSSVNSPVVLVDAVTITVFYSIGTQVYSQTSAPGGLHVFNDPGDGEINLNFLPQETEGEGIVRILDENGRTCYSKKVSVLQGQEISEQIQVPSLLPGIYFFTLTTARHSYTRKLAILPQ